MFCRQVFSVTTTLRKSLNTGAASNMNLPLKYQEVEALGTTFNVAYVDVGESDAPVSLWLHGCPATHRTFYKLIQPLLDNGMRVILPDLPGYGSTKIDSSNRFDFSSSHKAAVIGSLVKKLEINRIAILGGHSVGAMAITRLRSEIPELNIQSFVLINPLGIRRHWIAKHQKIAAWSGWTLYHLTHFPLLGSVVARLLSPVYTRIGLPPSYDPQSQIFSHYEAGILNFSQYQQDLQSLVDSGIPVIFGYSSNDPIVEENISHHAVHCLGLNPSKLVNKNWELQDGTEEEERTQFGIKFERGGHFLFKSQEANQLLTAEMMKALKNVCL